MRSQHRSVTIAVVAVVASVLAICAAVLVTSSTTATTAVVELVSDAVKNWYGPLAPMHTADRLFIYWGEGVDHYDSARVIHSALALQHAPEYVTSLETARFRGLSLACCSVIVFPPFAHGFPVFGPDSRIATRIARFVAQGNTAIVTGGVTDLLFLNAYFKLQLEPTPYAPGPFVRRYSRLPPILHKLNIPSKLHQSVVETTGVSIASLPMGSVVIYDDLQAATPVFMFKYCMINNPKSGEPPKKVQPRSCPRWKKKGFPCGCGNIIVVTYSYPAESLPEWSLLLRNLVTFAQMPPKPPGTKAGKSSAQLHRARGSRRRMQKQ